MVFLKSFPFPFFANAYLPRVEFGIALTFFFAKSQKVTALFEQHQRAFFTQIYTFQDWRKKILNKTFIIICLEKQ